jgi:predicted transcriptional regulator
VATETKPRSGAIVQSWVPPRLAAELKQLADRDRRSVSAIIRHALEDRLREDRDR